MFSNSSYNFNRQNVSNFPWISPPFRRTWVQPYLPVGALGTLSIRRVSLQLFNSFFINSINTNWKISSRVETFLKAIYTNNLDKSYDSFKFWRYFYNMVRIIENLTNYKVMSTIQNESYFFWKYRNIYKEVIENNIKKRVLQMVWSLFCEDITFNFFQFNVVFSENAYQYRLTRLIVAEDRKSLEHSPVKHKIWHVP